jgi:hypothetical protein
VSGTRGVIAASVGWAVIGLLVGHVAAYDLVLPDAHVHDAALAESGHAWLGLLEPSLLAAVALVVVGCLLAARTDRPRAVRFHRLVVVQVGAFVAVELAERLLAGYSAADLTHALVDHGLWLILVVGTVAQVISAWLGSAASRGLAAATTMAGQPPHRTRRAPLIALGDASPAPSRPVAHRRSRAPPQAVLVR